MPGSTALFQSEQDEEERKKSELATSRQLPPVAPRRATVTLQSWQSVTSESESYGDNKHARSSSMDSLESSGSSSSGGGYGVSSNRSNESQIGEYIPTRLLTKAPQLPPHNPLQFVKVQSPLYKKAEQQIKLTKEVKICREALKEGEEEWQSVSTSFLLKQYKAELLESKLNAMNLDNWKSRRRKVTEKVNQRAEEMRQIEAEEQLRHEQNLMQQRKIKKFSEIVERKSARNYSLDLYIGQGDDSGLGGTPEPDDAIDCQCSILRSDTSEGMTSEAESIDSDSHRSDKHLEKEPPVVPKKPHSWLKRNAFIHSNNQQTSTQRFLSDVTNKDIHGFDNNSSTEISDAEGHVCDSETISSEEDICFVDPQKLESDQENVDHNLLPEDEYVRENYIPEAIKNSKSSSNSPSTAECSDAKSIYNSQTEVCNQTHSFKLCIKPGDNKGFGFSVKGGKDLGCAPCIDSVLQDGPAYLIGLTDGDEIVALNGEPACAYSHASLLFTIKQAVYSGILEIEVSRVMTNDLRKEEVKSKSTSKKSSFAEKLAIFSSSVNSNSDVCSKTSANADVKESLVQRRRSTFENRKSEKVVQRRASYLLEETSNTNKDVIEKRFSVDFSTKFCPQKNGAARKDPPPPVPVKPKIRPKLLVKSQTIHDYECDSFSQTGNSSANNFISPPFEPVNNEPFENFNQYAFSDSLKVEEAGNFEQIETKNDMPTYVNSPCVSELSSTNNNTTVLNITSQPYKIEHQLTLDIKENHEPENILNSQTDLDGLTKKINLGINTFENKIALVNETVPEKDSSPTYATAIEVSFKNISNIDTSDCVELTTAPFAQDTPSSIINVDPVTDELNEFNASACKDVENLNLCSTVLESLSLESIEENVNEHNSPDYEHPSTDNDADTLVAVETNPSPLCLSLEKTEDDDGVSASTTTSSDTPDTETVIETLPLNLSPLPNDESNGEETISHLNNYEEEETVKNVSVREKSDVQCTTTDGKASNQSSCIEPHFQEDIIDQQDFGANLDNFPLSNDSFIDEQDEEYRRELDESLDQITSLDVIDEMEQRLMQQLEHQDDNFEDLENGLELENEINQDWIYYSEADLLDDLTSRNREPPKEPPPPPPLESEVDTEQAFPLNRINSTKRIKKELWRRRSDFLGLDSSESSIDVDTVVPPPPGLEEILKLEREQNQWLEKRLSIVESENVTDSSLSTQSTFGDSQDLMPTDYSSNYLLEEDENLKLDFDSTVENWQENLEENVFEPDSESFSATVSCSMTEESSKGKESPQHKAKQNIQNLGAAPKAKIMDSNKWITERVASTSKRVTEPLFRQTSYDQNYWIAQDALSKRTPPEAVPNRRYSMASQPNNFPDVTLRTWDDRVSELPKQRPRSAQWNSPNKVISDDSGSYSKQGELRTQSLDDYEDIECSSDVLESEMHMCSCCGEGLCEGSAMGIEALMLYFHIECFRCSMCQMPLGNGMSGTDVQVKNNQLFCPNCFTVD